jgi:hypothetical protein
MEKCKELSHPSLKSVLDKMAEKQLPFSGSCSEINT